ncbi:uncharacterized protein LOC142984527 [Anticarsia gemmatalis]|uniref:uncharacterized protein LOC142984527 n=1 Tax=Anticarsia gemmatalis TaxID=129554 RepID=UPI003F775F62
MSSEGSDIELPSALPKKQNKKIPKSPSEDILKKNSKEPPKKMQEKKLSTKMMIHQALIDLKTRKGVSLYAIKKYITEKYSVDTEKINYIIKKAIKSSIEEGSVVQTKGIGATGSFKLVPVKEKKSKPKKVKLDEEGNEIKKKPVKPKKSKEKSKKSMEKSAKSKSKSKEKKSEEKPGILKKKTEKEKIPKEKKIGEEKGKKMKLKLAKGMQTPAKKKSAMLKRKSIGSIIKPPKMKPKAKA